MTKCLVTVRTLVWSSRTVSCLVLLKMSLLTESLVTYATLEWSLSCNNDKINDLLRLVFSVYSVTINPEQATLGHVNWGVIYDDFNHEIPLFNSSLNYHVFMNLILPE